jgi:UDPglucose 6-dehydrogenase
MRVAVVGTGYVGLVAGVCFADAGNEVVCVDVDRRKVERLKAGDVPIYEPGLHEILHRAQREGHLTFTTSHAEAVRGARAAFIAVGTPEGPDGRPMLDQTDKAVEDVVRAATGPLVLVLKSTVPVGTAARTRARIPGFTKHRVDVVSNPEFLKEGTAVDDFLRPDRVVVGTDSDQAFHVLEELYRPFTMGEKPILRMSNAAAELTKYAANAMLATRISFMNEIALLCDAVGADVKDVQRGIGTDARIGRAFLFAGCGYGGSCFPKDTQGLIHVAREAGVDLRIVPAVEAVNDRQKRLVADRVVERLGEDLCGRRIAVWGLAFKPKTDDVREAPAQVVIDQLLQRGASVSGSDPEGLANFRSVFGDRMEYEEDPYRAAEGADALLLLTEWHEFRGADFARLAKSMRQPLVYDGRNVLDAEAARAAGVEVVGIGRGHHRPREAAPAARSGRGSSS